MSQLLGLLGRLWHKQPFWLGAMLAVSEIMEAPNRLNGDKVYIVYLV